mgnify:CR=1 FL=1
MITKNKFVTVSYELRTAADAEPIEIADEKTPLEFVVKGKRWNISK